MSSIRTKLVLAAICLAAIMAVGVPAMAVLENERGPTEATMQFSEPTLVEEFRVRIENTKDGSVTISHDGGDTWDRLGTVLMPAVVLNPHAYTAAGWSEPGTVAAAAVNSNHIKVRQSAEAGRGTIFSILPVELMVKPDNYNSYYNSSASIITDIPAGTGIFGRYGFYVGDPILIETTDGLTPLPLDYEMREGEVFVIQVLKPEDFPTAIIFENRFGGLITVKFGDGRSMYIGQVLKPAYGVGRFGGSLYTDVGRLRANHSGVVCLSTSPMGEVGGFQILPENHGMSPEMKNARVLTQWMVVGPLNALEPSTEGVGPLFKYYLSPRFWRPSLSEPDWVDQVMSRLIWQVRLDGGEWQRPPAIWGRVDEGLINMTHVRILLPQ